MCVSTHTTMPAPSEVVGIPGNCGLEACSVGDWYVSGGIRFRTVLIKPSYVRQRSEPKARWPPRPRYARGPDFRWSETYHILEPEGRGVRRCFRRCGSGFPTAGRDGVAFSPVDNSRRIRVEAMRIQVGPF